MPAIVPSLNIDTLLPINPLGIWVDLHHIWIMFRSGAGSAHAINVRKTQLSNKTSVGTFEISTIMRSITDSTDQFSTRSEMAATANARGAAITSNSGIAFWVILGDKGVAGQRPAFNIGMFNKNTDGLLHVMSRTQYPSTLGHQTRVLGAASNDNYLYVMYSEGPAGTLAATVPIRLARFGINAVNPPAFPVLNGLGTLIPEDSTRTVRPAGLGILGGYIWWYDKKHTGAEFRTIATEDLNFTAT